MLFDSIASVIDNTQNAKRTSKRDKRWVSDEIFLELAKTCFLTRKHIESLHLDCNVIIDIM